MTNSRSSISCDRSKRDDWRSGSVWLDRRLVYLAGAVTPGQCVNDRSRPERPRSMSAVESAVGGKAENMFSIRALPVMTDAVDKSPMRSGRSRRMGPVHSDFAPARWRWQRHLRRRPTAMGVGRRSCSVNAWDRHLAAAARCGSRPGGRDVRGYRRYPGGQSRNLTTPIRRPRESWHRSGARAAGRRLRPTLRAVYGRGRDARRAPRAFHSWSL